MTVGEACISDEVVETTERSDVGLAQLRAIGSLLIGITSFNEQRRQLNRRSGAQAWDHYLVQVFTEGALHGASDGAALPAGARDICIFDPSQPPKNRLDTGSTTLSVMLPRPLLDKAVGSLNLHGLVLKAGSPITSLIVAYIEALYALKASLPRMQASAAQESVVTLLSAALKVPVAADSGQAASQGAGLRHRVVEFMSRNLSLLELSPDFLCRRFNVSRAHLYRAFAASGGVAKVLRDMRLDEVYRELTQLTRDSRSITEMAWSLGFSSSNQLLRSFRARFGITPSEAKAAAVNTA